MEYLDNITNDIPIELTQLLNDFNNGILLNKSNIELKALKIRTRHNNRDYDGIKIRYSVKDTKFFFQLEYLMLGILSLGNTIQMRRIQPMRVFFIVYHLVLL